ncbi:fatty-acyl-CoA synthase [Rhodococcus wratislaviensis]|uniref:AMP-binding protein n=3 Tax=Rhodococcus TaxID=1827 RepID=A0AB38FCI6_RHOWR|nr:MULTISPECIES: AMP-binding protein [Rhodococcus]AII07756.1 AMP-binding protein [Rhodococcus opacus]REE75622.1 fatty-acyl-CoA synthase [Rhodococcus wratislaviensis]GAF50237.1 putative fatty-acid--CoA ligase [Rhodococcus wratislaviensis NBRC 100605]SPZ39342.1 AMP-binding protein [Rhodococcus wratislaviensis]
MNTRLSHSVGPTERALLEMTIGDNFDRTAARFPEREAVVDVPTGRRWTYAGLRADVDALASALLEEGIVPGDRVAIWAPNCPEWVLVQFAAAKVGAILVTLNPAYRSHELEYVLTQSGIRLVFAVPSFKTSDYEAMVTEVSPRCPGLDRVIIFGSDEWDSLLIRGDQASSERLTAVQAGLSPDDPINIQYTSGTTGFPKGVTLSHRNILNNGFFVGELLGYTEQDRICVPVPFYHCFGMVMGNLGASTHGACVVIPSPSFDPVATLTACAHEQCTSVYGVPTMFISMLDVPNFASYDLSSVRTGAMAGSPCPVEIMKQVTQWVPEVAIAYGMTETSPASTQTWVDDSLDRRVSTVGRAHPHVEVKVVDPATGETVPRGRSGELCIRGYSVMLGYWNEPERTTKAIDADGWIHSGDLAVMDEDGFVAITGRIKDMVIRGGENIYPREIEEFLYTHPDILDAQVIGVPDSKYGEELMVWLRLREGAEKIDASSLREFCKGRIAHFKVPRYVHCVDQFPMTVSGKVRKVEMREQALQILGL